MLEVLDADPHEAETRYWLGARPAEAPTCCSASCRRRVPPCERRRTNAPRAWEDRAATMGRFALDLRGARMRRDLARPVSPAAFGPVLWNHAAPQSDPPVQARLANWLEGGERGLRLRRAAPPARTYLDCRGACVARGAGLNVILPCPVATFRRCRWRRSIRRWCRAFDRLPRTSPTPSTNSMPRRCPRRPPSASTSAGFARPSDPQRPQILQSEPLGLQPAGEQDGAAGKEHGATRLLSLPASAAQAQSIST